MAITVRDATPADAERLVRWNAALALETEGRTLDAATLARGVAAVLTGTVPARYLVAEADGAAAGGLMLTPEWSDWRARDWWWVQSVYVEPGRRRQGVFRTLLAEVERRARAAGVAGLRLYVERHNDRARASYAALGFDDPGYRMLQRAVLADM